MPGVIIKPTSKYVLTNSAGVIFDQIDGGIVTYMRKAWFTLPSPSVSPGDVPFWLSTQDYTDLFVYHDHLAMMRFLTPDAAHKLVTTWKYPKRNGKINEVGHSLQLSNNSPHPVSYIHTKVSGGYLPIEAILWSDGTVFPLTLLPVIPSGPFIHFTAEILYRTIPRVNSVTGGTMTVYGSWPQRVSTLWGSNICGGLQYATFVPGSDGDFVAYRELMPDEIAGANSGGLNNIGVIFPDNLSGVRINGITLTWRY